MRTPSSASPLASPPLTRRALLRRSAAAAVAGALAWTPLGRSAPAEVKRPAATKGRIRQSIAHWCFEAFGEKWNVDQLCRVAKELGCPSVELVAVDQYPTVRQHGLTCALCQINTDPDPPFVKGFNHPEHWPKVMKATRDAIDAAAAFGFPNVIAFTGYSAQDPGNPNSPLISREDGARNCVAGLKQVMGYAEKNRVTLCLEQLNTRDTTHPMKGHPGYQGEHLDYCVEIIKQVGSPRMKLLFDIYHAQIMDGDLIRHLRQYRDYLGHVHTAGCPGRGELGAAQEINFPAVMKALLDVGYTGYVGHEFIPTGNAYQVLREAVRLCDV